MGGEKGAGVLSFLVYLSSVFSLSLPFSLGRQVMVGHQQGDQGEAQDVLPGRRREGREGQRVLNGRRVRERAERGWRRARVTARHGTPRLVRVGGAMAPCEVGARTVKKPRSRSSIIRGWRWRRRGSEKKK